MGPIDTRIHHRTDGLPWTADRLTRALWAALHPITPLHQLAVDPALDAIPCQGQLWLSQAVVGLRLLRYDRDLWGILLAPWPDAHLAEAPIDDPLTAAARHDAWDRLAQHPGLHATSTAMIEVPGVLLRWLPEGQRLHDALEAIGFVEAADQAPPESG